MIKNKKIEYYIYIQAQIKNGFTRKLILIEFLVHRIRNIFKISRLLLSIIF